MSNHLAIATVSATLSQLLQDAVGSDMPGAAVRLGKPAANGSQAAAPEVSLYLYQVTPNAAYRNTDLPSRDPDGRIIQRPRAALDLHYLVSFAGDESRLEPQRLLGGVARTLHAHPVLCRHLIRDTIANPAFSFLAASNLADDIELVKLTQLPLSLEELSKMWSVFFQIPYTLSVAYQGTVVLIESEDTAQSALPVRERNVYPIPFKFPTIDEVASLDGKGRKIVADSSLVITGKQLRGDVTLVVIGGIEQAPSTLSDTRITVQVPSDLRAGVQALQVVHQILIGTPATPHRGVQSNVAAMVLCPRITSVDGVQHGGDRSGRPGQSAPLNGSRCSLNERAVTSPASYTFTAPARSSDATSLQIPVSGVKAAAEYFVRIQVDGAESPLDLDPASAVLWTDGGDSMTRSSGVARSQSAAPHGVAGPDPEGCARARERVGRRPATCRDVGRTLEDELRAAEDALAAPSALDTLCAVFGLSLFERTSAAVVRGRRAGLRASRPRVPPAQGDRRRAYPTFSLALATLPDAHWSAITPAAPLRRWRLIEVGPGDSLTTSPLKIDEPILHYLTGTRYADDRLRGFLNAGPGAACASSLVSNARSQIERLWSHEALAEDRTHPPVVQLCGSRHRGKRMVAASACAHLGLRLQVMRAADVPAPIAERDALVRLWDREALLSGSALLLDCDDVDLSERTRSVLPFVDALQSVAVIATREPMPLEKRRAGAAGRAPPDRRGTARDVGRDARRARAPRRRRAQGRVESFPSRPARHPGHLRHGHTGSGRSSRPHRHGNMGRLPHAVAGAARRSRATHRIAGRLGRSRAARSPAPDAERHRGAGAAPVHGARDLGVRREGRPRSRHECPLRRSQRHRQDDGRGGAGERAAARSAIASISARWSASTSARPRRTCAACSTRRRTAARCCSSTRPTPSSANAARSRTATIATPTSRSAISCSGWRPIEGSRSWPPT